MPIDAKEATEASLVALKAKAHEWTGVWHKIHAATEAGHFSTSIIPSDFDGDDVCMNDFRQAMHTFGYQTRVYHDDSGKPVWCWIEW